MHPVPHEDYQWASPGLRVDKCLSFSMREPSVGHQVDRMENLRLAFQMVHPIPLSVQRWDLSGLRVNPCLVRYFRETLVRFPEDRKEDSRMGRQRVYRSTSAVPCPINFLSRVLMHRLEDPRPDCRENHHRVSSALLAFHPRDPMPPLADQNHFVPLLGTAACPEGNQVLQQLARCSLIPNLRIYQQIAHPQLCRRAYRRVFYQWRPTISMGDRRPLNLILKTTMGHERGH